MQSMVRFRTLIDVLPILPQVLEAAAHLQVARVRTQAYLAGAVHVCKFRCCFLRHAPVVVFVGPAGDEEISDVYLLGGEAAPLAPPQSFLGDKREGAAPSALALRRTK